MRVKIGTLRRAVYQRKAQQGNYETARRALLTRPLLARIIRVIPSPNPKGLQDP